MVFHSFAFLLFLFTLAFLFLVSRKSPWVLLGGSVVFYLTVAPRYLVLLAAVTVLAWRLALAIGAAGEEKKKLRLAAAGVLGFVGLLAFFKYALLRTALLGALLPQDTLSGILLPVGMSYYLFKVIGYLVDVYWEKYPPEKSLLHFAAYVTFFPQIVSGPIQRPADFLSQLQAREVTAAHWASGLRRLLFGLFTKLVVAARLGELVDPVYAAPAGRPTLVLVFAVYLFALQLYADFSALSSIAIGAGRLFGIQGPENFDAPYLAANLPDFWRRWHMSLTSWLTDYVYSPVRHLLRRWGDAGLAIAIVVNMAAVGVWHGERLSYLVFGLVNGVLMAFSALTARRRNRFFRARPRLARARLVWGPIVTFHLIDFSFIFFRAPSLTDAGLIFSQIFSGAAEAFLHPGTVSVGVFGAARRAFGLSPAHAGLILFGVVVMVTGHHLLRDERAKARFLALPWYGRWAAYYAAVGAILLAGRFDADTFIYAQF